MARAYMFATPHLQEFAARWEALDTAAVEETVAPRERQYRKGHDPATAAENAKAMNWLFSNAR